MSPLAIHLDDDRTEFEPGESISVTIEWSFPEPPDSIELRAVWNTVGKGTRDLGIEHSITIDSPSAAESRRIELSLPSAPYSFSGQLVSLVWALELVSKPRPNSCRREVTIAPGGSEVLLQRATI